MNFESLSSWLANKGNTLTVAGPCSAESEQQVMRVAETLAADGRINLMRAGAWKPRTRPGSFEGFGTLALPWLAKAQREFDLPVVVEVARESHVKAALDAGLRHFWIGARTTVSPFAVQEVADALAGADVPVLIKNPINADLELWMGAIERFWQSGLTKLVAVHRGFAAKHEHYRNHPIWEIPMALKSALPTLPIVVDPSHIAGERHLVAGLAQKALDLGFDGLMVETHPDPSKALSDAAQQIPLHLFTDFLNQLSRREPAFSDVVSQAELERLRAEIDRVDSDLLAKLRERMSLVQLIGRFKYEHQVAIFQPSRWAQIMADRQHLAAELGIESATVLAIWNELHKASIRKQIEAGSASVSQSDALKAPSAAEATFGA